jgi:hypothetical protein
MSYRAIRQGNSEGPFATPVTATADEVRVARELPRKLQQRYLDERKAPREPSAAWCVGAD